MQRLLGIDLTKTHVRAALLNASLRKVKVEAFEEVRIEDAGSEKEAIWAAVGDIKADGAAVVLSGERAVLRRLDLPATAQREIQNVLSFELESTVPFEMEEAVFDYRVLSRAKDKGDASVVTVLAAVARIEDVKSRAEVVKQAIKIDPERVGVGAMPLANLTLVMPELEGAPVKKGEPTDARPVAILNLGERTSDMLFLEQGEPVFLRSISRGTHGLPNSAPQLARELRQTLAAWRSQGGELLRGMYLIGGGAQAAGASEYLATELGVAVLPLPEARMEMTDELREKFPKFAMATGLALGLLGRSKALNLRRGALEVQRSYPFLREKTPLFAGLAAAIGVSFVFSILSENRSLEREQAELKSRLAAVSQEVLGEPTEDPERAKELVETGPGAEEDPMPQVDAFDMMVQLSKAVPKEVTHDVLEMDIARTGHVTLQGKVGSVADAQSIADKLKEHRCFQNVKISRTSQLGDDKQKYTLELDLKCDKKKKEKEKDKEKPADSADSAAPSKEGGR